MLFKEKKVRFLFFKFYIVSLHFLLLLRENDKNNMTLEALLTWNKINTELHN